MQKPLTIITGASRGLGLAMAAQRLGEGHRVLSIARTQPALAASPELQCWQADLADAKPVAERLEAWLAAADHATLSTATLILNAGVVSKPAPLEGVDPDDLINALRVGLEAPLLLGRAFLRATKDLAVPRKLLFISSGLGRRAMAASASYCAAKAGVDHLARALALEQAAQRNGARVVSLAPGVIDTDMQRQLREADPALFPEQQRFAALQQEGRLDSPQEAAAKVLAYVDRADYGSVATADVRDV